MAREFLSSNPDVYKGDLSTSYSSPREEHKYNSALAARYEWV